MKLPSFPQFVKSIVFALILAVIAYFLFPVLGLGEAAPQKLFVLTLALGVLLGGVLTNLQFSAPAAAGKGSGKVTIFVGNLAFKATPPDLERLFSPYGTVHSVRIMKDRATRRPRGFAFVEIDASQANRAIKDLEGKEFLGRNLRVSEGVERQ
jgi:hypothetical protein